MQLLKPFNSRTTEAISEFELYTLCTSLYAGLLIESLIREEAFYLLRVSYLWYALSGTFIVLIIGTLVSFLTKPQDPDQLDPKLVFRFLRNRVGRKRVSTVVQQVIHLASLLISFYKLLN